MYMCRSVLPEVRSVRVGCGFGFPPRLRHLHFQTFKKKSLAVFGLMWEIQQRATGFRTPKFPGEGVEFGLSRV